MGCKIGLILYCILQCIAFLFILVGTPIDQFRGKGGSVWGNTGCLTFWGTKTKCYSTKYEIRTPDLWSGCKGRKSRFQAAEAFSIISIFVFLVAVIFGFIQLCCCSCLRWVCLVLNIVGVITALVCWACMASEYTSNRFDGVISSSIAGMPCAKLKIGYKYGAGFALFVTGWCLCLINIVFLMLPC